MTSSRSSRAPWGSSTAPGVPPPAGAADGARGSGPQIIGSRFSPDVRRLREFLIRNRQPYGFVDVEDDVHAEAVLRHVGLTPAETPVALVRGRGVLRNPSNAALAAASAWRDRHAAPTATYDLVVVGVGPAGPRRRRVRRLGGAGNAGAGRRGHRWAGRHVVPDRELPRLPGRPVRSRAGPAGTGSRPTGSAP
jgi:hypothetical protein